MAFTRYCFTFSRLCTNQSSCHSSGSPALPTLLQYYCTSIGQYTTPHPILLIYAIHHTTLAMAISCKNQVNPNPNGELGLGLGLTRLAWPHRRLELASDGVRYTDARNTVGRRARRVARRRLEWYVGKFIMLQQRSKHSRKVVLTPKASISNCSVCVVGGGGVAPTRYWDRQYCVVHSIKRGGRWGVVHYAMFVQ